MFRRHTIVAGVASLVMAVGSVQAQVSNVFNMPSGQTSLQFVTVGDPGNAADTTPYSPYGAVPYVYQIGKYDVTVGQYCQFLNAVAATDTYGLYHSYMSIDMPTIKITQSGTSGNYSYSVTGSYSQAANCPVFDVTWGDAARFCNWLQNGQPTGAEGPGTTETGAYTLNGWTDYTDLITVTRNVGATYVIPTENEWYKAAYYKGGSTNAGYWAYPTKSNTAPINILSSTGTNNANFTVDSELYSGCTDPTNRLTPVGAFAASPGPYDTFDMGGDVWQWNETAIGFSDRGLRGGCWYDDSNTLTAYRSSNYPAFAGMSVGFRVASVPEPGSIMLVVVGGLCLLAFAWRRRK